MAGAAVGAVLVGGTEGRRVGVAVAGEEVGGPVGSAVVGRADGACGELVQAVESARSNASEVIVNQGPWHALASILGLMLGSNQPKMGTGCLWAARSWRAHRSVRDMDADASNGGAGAVCPVGASGRVASCWGVRVGPWDRSAQMCVLVCCF